MSASADWQQLAGEGCPTGCLPTSSAWTVDGVEMACSERGLCSGRHYPVSTVLECPQTRFRRRRAMLPSAGWNALRTRNSPSGEKVTVAAFHTQCRALSLLRCVQINGPPPTFRAFARLEDGLRGVKHRVFITQVIMSDDSGTLLQCRREQQTTPRSGFLVRRGQPRRGHTPQLLQFEKCVGVGVETCFWRDGGAGSDGEDPAGGLGLAVVPFE